MSRLAERMSVFDISSLYVVITGEFCGNKSQLDTLADCLDSGVRIVQLREKDIDANELYELALEFRRITHNNDTLLIIDDRLDIALAVGADGVHLGQRDLPVEVARHVAPDLIIGASTHSLEQAQTAERSGASYVNIGPIFPTNTKATSVPPLGPQSIAEISPQLSIPFTCMGGISMDNIDLVIQQGARHIAVVTAVTLASNPREAAAELIKRIETANSA